MDRRSFFKRLLQATAGATVAYSFPSIIVPKNLEKSVENVGRIYIVSPSTFYDFGFTGWKEQNGIYIGQLSAKVQPGRILATINNLKI